MRVNRHWIHAAVGGALVLLLGATPAWAQTARPELEAKIPLGEVHGRIDHLAIDSSRLRLFVAELGNDTVGVVDLKERKTNQTLTGLKEPQGIGYMPSSDTLYVANGSDGTVRLFRGSDLAPAGQIPFGDDADNVRIDPANHRVIVGYGNGSLAVIDSTTQQKVADIRLKGHPESFQLDSAGQHIYVNVPDARQIAVVARGTSSQSATWTTNDLHANYPLALDESHERVLAVFRHPSRLGIFRMQDGTLITSVPTCGDADDVFLDPKRSAIYVICGEGYIDVIGQQGDQYHSTARIPTASGARTGLFVPAIDRLLVAVRASFGTPAAIWVFNLEP